MSQVLTKTYEGSSIEEILPQIRAEMGDDAIVVRQREGLRGGVGGFFQKRCVEVEARPGRPVALTAAPVSVAAMATPAARPSLDLTDGPRAIPPGYAPLASVTPMPIAEPTPETAHDEPVFAPAADFGRQLQDAVGAQAADASVAAASQRPAQPAALSVDDILTMAPDPTDLVVPAAVAPPEVAVAPEPVVPVVAQAAPEPVVPVVATPVTSPVPVPVTPVSVSQLTAAAERVVGQLTDRGLDREFVEAIVTDVSDLRVPLAPKARFSTMALRELAAQIPVAGLTRAPVTAWVGTSGAGKTAAIASFARAHADHGGLKVCCIALNATDGGIGLRTALQGSGVDVYAAHAATDAPGLIAQLVSTGWTVLVDTPSVSPRRADEITALADSLQTVGATDVQLCVAATLSRAVAHDLLEAMAPVKPAAITMTRTDETERIGAVVGLSIETQLPIAYLASVDAEGHHLHAADALDLAKTLVG